MNVPLCAAVLGLLVVPGCFGPGQTSYRVSQWEVDAYATPDVMVEGSTGTFNVTVERIKRADWGPAPANFSVEVFAENGLTFQDEVVWNGSIMQDQVLSREFRIRAETAGTGHLYFSFAGGVGYPTDTRGESITWGPLEVNITAPPHEAG